MRTVPFRIVAIGFLLALTIGAIRLLGTGFSLRLLASGPSLLLALAVLLPIGALAFFLLRTPGPAVALRDLWLVPATAIPAAAVLVAITDDSWFGALWFTTSFGLIAPLSSAYWRSRGQGPKPPAA